MISAAIITILSITIIVIGGELYAPLKDWLKHTFTHHWLGKSILSFAIFAVGFLVVYPLQARFPADEHLLSRSLWWLVRVVLFATIALVVFYLYEYIKPFTH